MLPATRRRLGISLIVLGIAIIVAAVLVVCDLADGPGTGPKTFATRRGYDQVKVELQKDFPVAFLVGLGGLGLAMLGSRIARREESEG